MRNLSIQKGVAKPNSKRTQDERMPELDRRDFLKLVGVTTGAAAAAGCSVDPVEKLIPYVIQPEEVLPGTSTTYASTCMECSVGCGLHVTSREGRPIKLEGHPDHPINKGTLCARGQVGLGRVYHPDRVQGPMVKGSNGLSAISWADAQAKVAGKIKASPSGSWILGGPVGPTLKQLMDEWVSATGAAGRVAYQPFANEALRSAAEMVFGRNVLPEFDLSTADLVLDFSSDFLDQGLSPVEHAMQFSQSKQLSNHGGATLVSVGPRLSMTASKADKWIPTVPGGEGALALALALVIYDKSGGKDSGGGAPLEGDIRGVNDLFQGQNLGQLLKQAGVDQHSFDALVTKLLAANHAVAMPPGVSAASSSATSDAAAVLLLNVLLGGLDTRLKIPAEDSAEHGAPYSEIQALISAMKAGKVDVLLIHDANPVYSLPAASGFVEALGSVGTVVSFASQKDETSQIADLVLPDHDAFESWGDVSPRSGIRTVVQPTIRPLFDTQGVGDTLLAIAREAGATVTAGSFLDRLKGAWSGSDWRQTLASGGEFTPAAVAPAAIAPTVSQIKTAPPALAGRGGFTLVAYPHSFVGDGSAASLPWMQEIPDPVARASWLSWLEISENACQKLGVDYGEVVEVKTDAGSVKLPVYPRGGIQDDVIAIAIGQGHTVGHYASLEGDGRPGVARGVSVISLLSDAADDKGARAWLSTKATVSATGLYQRIPLTQFTDNQRGRKLAPTISLAALATGEAHLGDLDGAESHDAGHGESHEIVLPFDAANDADPNSPYRWSMSIDNDKCTGCGACVAACYTENSIPIVGEDGMAQHREMSWIRIERYVDEGDRSDGQERRPHPDREALGKTDVRYAPMLCQHCGAAPCESVCPVIATYHSPDGLNAMIYNRCVGTRYCANNCVYKVRRFNYWDYSREKWPANMNLMHNPDVTTRQQGVMEKCTFCVQRIATARQTAKDEGRPIADGEVKTACQQTCPSQAIQFGNAKDKKSKVVEAAGDEKRAYHSLHVLNTRPAITYLKQVDRADDERSHG